MVDGKYCRCSASEITHHESGAAFLVVRIKEAVTVAGNRRPILIRLAKGDLHGSIRIGQVDAPDIIMRSSQIAAHVQALAVRRPTGVVNAGRKSDDPLRFTTRNRDLPNVCLRAIISRLLFSY